MESKCIFVFVIMKRPQNPIKTIIMTFDIMRSEDNIFIIKFVIKLLDIIFCVVYIKRCLINLYFKIEKN